MPLPKALQQAINDTPAPDNTSNVFDFEAGNKVVQPAATPPLDTSSDDTTVDVDTTSEGWLDALMTGGEPDNKSGVDDMFITDTDGEAGGFSLPDMETDKDSQFNELKDIISKLEGKINKTDAEDAQQKLLNDSLDALKEKYGEVDQDILDNFSELHSTFRASFGQDIEAEMVKNKIENDLRIKQLEQKIEQLSSPVDSNPAAKTDPTDYRNLMAEAVPEYQKIISSNQFKQLMSTPVDSDNPDFTFNQKLGKLYGQRKTADILKFFSSFADKYMASGKGNGAVVDSGKSSSSQGGQSGKNTLSPDRLRSIFKKVMNGELKLSESEMLKLRQMAAKQTMD